MSSNHKLAYGIRVSSLKSLCNCWTTTKRYQHGGVHDCILCGKKQSDYQWHILTCPHMTNGLKSILPNLTVPTCEVGAMHWYCFIDGPDEGERSRRMVVNDLVLFVYDQARHCPHKGNGHSFAVGPSLRARIRHWGRGHCPSFYREVIFGMLQTVGR